MQPDSPHCFCTSPAKQCGFSICLSTPTYRHRRRLGATPPIGQNPKDRGARQHPAYGQAGPHRKHRAGRTHRSDRQHRPLGADRQYGLIRPEAEEGIGRTNRPFTITTHVSQPTAGLQHAGDAPLNFGTLQGNLAEPNVVQGFNAFAPRIDLGPVDVPGGHIILEEQRQG